ncbi:hypothetical protein ACZ87_03955 [Candidatus Erwinia dacicola]|uniref:Uncharacterized protein n=1 Tax=Candidatus Erwinia dacicola TaxID=252393 RepID=A0A328THC9_9GAMM|nr:hypothetical protein ACZ87_03955 [Candidatus Erwinia dacicola]
MPGDLMLGGMGTFLIGLHEHLLYRRFQAAVRVGDDRLYPL